MSESDGRYVPTQSTRLLFPFAWFRSVLPVSPYVILELNLKIQPRTIRSLLLLHDIGLDVLPSHE